MPLPELEVCECTGDASKQIENFSESLNQTSGRVRELINKGKYQQAIPKSGRWRLRELLITVFKARFKCRILHAPKLMQMRKRYCFANFFFFTFATFKVRRLN